MIGARHALGTIRGVWWWAVVLAALLWWAPAIALALARFPLGRLRFWLVIGVAAESDTRW